MAVIVFDLEKTLPTLLLSCGKVYYRRQLWTHNYCIHNAGSKKATMFMWDESQFSRGCLAIASCILKFIQVLPPEVTHLVAFSDNCSGQNKSALTVKFWSWVTRSTNIKKVDHKFFVPGHSYNECDRNFGIVEKFKRCSSKDVYVSLHWTQVVAKSSKNFIVVNMADDDFVNIDPITIFLLRKLKESANFNGFSSKETNRSNFTTVNW